MSEQGRAVVSVIGRDQKGVVARVSTYLASYDINIEDIEQRVMEGLFIMRFINGSRKVLQQIHWRHI